LWHATGMAKKRARRHHGGSIRELKSGRWQVRVYDRATGRHVTLGTFPTKEDANASLAAAVADQNRGKWVTPQRGLVPVGEYCQRWIDDHTTSTETSRKGTTTRKGSGAPHQEVVERSETTNNNTELGSVNETADEGGRNGTERSSVTGEACCDRFPGLNRADVGNAGNTDRDTTGRFPTRSRFAVASPCATRSRTASQACSIVTSGASSASSEASRSRWETQTAT
jgi:hypothetical protein